MQAGLGKIDAMVKEIQEITEYQNMAELIEARTNYETLIETPQVLDSEKLSSILGNSYRRIRKVANNAARNIAGEVFKGKGEPISLPDAKLVTCGLQLARYTSMQVFVVGRDDDLYYAGNRMISKPGYRGRFERAMNFTIHIIGSKQKELNTIERWAA